MRNLKKLLAVVLTVVMIASMMVPALAANTYEDEALKLQSIGMFAGEPADLKLEEGVTRIQGLAFAIRAAGKEADAFAMTDEEVATILADWTDAASIPAWGLKYAAYAIKNTITLGLSTTQKIFGALNPISGTSFLVFLMRSGMGYADVTTADVVEASVDAGILTAGQAAAFGAKAALIRDDAAGILFGAAMNGVNADGTALIDALIASGFVDEDAAIAAGFVEEVVPVDLEVLDAKLINLRQIQIQFNMAMDKDSAKTATNYTVTAGKTIQHVGLSDDGTIVTLTLNSAVTNQTGKITVSVSKDIKNVNGDKLGTKFYARDLTFTDTALPTLDSVKVIGNKKLEVIFSEPVTGAAKSSNFKIDDKLFAASNVVLDSTETARKVTITLANRLAAGEHTIELLANKVADMATLTNVSSTITFAVEAVTDAPSATIIKATTTKITVQFDREIITATPKAKFGSNTVNMVQDEDDKTIYYATFGANVIPNAGGDLLILKPIEDYFGNKTTADLKISFVPTFDNERPEVVSITSEKENEMIIEFNEDILSATAGTITIKKANGKAVTGLTVAFAKTDAGKTIKNKVSVKATFKPEEGPFLVSVKGIKDLQNNPMVEVVDYEVDVPDKTAPIVKSVSVNSDDSKIAVTFSEEVNNADDLANYKYEISGKGIYAMPEDATIELSANGKSVVITLPEVWTIGSTEYDIDDIARLYITGVEDLAGNVMDDVAKDLEDAVEILAAWKSTKATAVDTIEIEFEDDDGALPATLYAGEFEVYKVGAEYTVATAELSGRKIILTLSDELPGDTTGIKVATADVIEETKTALGTEFVITEKSVTDKIAPAVKYDDIEVSEDENLTVLLPLTEELAAFDETAILVKSDGTTLVEGADYDTTQLNADEILIIFNGTFDLTKDISVSIPDASALLLNTDNGGNALEAMAVKTFKFDLSAALNVIDENYLVEAADVVVDTDEDDTYFILTIAEVDVPGDDTIDVTIKDATDTEVDLSGYYYTSYDGNNWLAVENDPLVVTISADANETSVIHLVFVDGGVAYLVSYQLVVEAD